MTSALLSSLGRNEWIVAKEEGFYRYYINIHSKLKDMKGVNGRVRKLQ